VDLKGGSAAGTGGSLPTSGATSGTAGFAGGAAAAAAAAAAFSSNKAEQEVLLPLLYLFGDDVEKDAMLRRKQERFGDCDRLLGEATVMLPPRPGSATHDSCESDPALHKSGRGDAGREEGRRHMVMCPLTFRGVRGGGTLRMEVGWQAVQENPVENVKVSSMPIVKDKKSNLLHWSKISCDHLGRLSHTPVRFSILGAS